MTGVLAIIRREKVEDVKTNLSDVGINGFTHWHVMGHGKQKGIVIEGIHYDELPKEAVWVVIPDDKKNDVVTAIIRAAKTHENGAAGDGRIFVIPILEGYTISQRVL